MGYIQIYTEKSKSERTPRNKSCLKLKIKYIKEAVYFQNLLSCFSHSLSLPRDDFSYTLGAWGRGRRYGSPPSSLSITYDSGLDFEVDLSQVGFSEVNEAARGLIGPRPQTADRLMGEEMSNGGRVRLGHHLYPTRDRSRKSPQTNLQNVYSSHPPQLHIGPTIHHAID
jgi:hypothetical protein